MTTDNRTTEPTPEHVEAAAKAMHGTRNPWFAAYGDWGAAGFEIKKAFRESARAALVAAQGAARPVNSFDTTVERVKNGGDSLHVAPVLPSLSNSEILERIAEQEREAAGAPAPQEPNQNETKSGKNLVSLDRSKVQDHLYFALRDAGEGRSTSERLASVGTRALCEAYKEGKLT